MSDHLPRGWALGTLPELVGSSGLLTDGDWVESKDQDESGSIRLTQLADVGDGFFRNRSHRFLRPDQAERLGCTLLHQGDVLIARMPDPLGRACVFPGLAQPAVTVVDVCIVRLNVDSVSPKWLTTFINSPSFRLAVAGEQRGSTRKRISKGSLSELSIPVPPSEEQERIADSVDSYLSRLDAAVATLEAAQAKLKAYRASVLKAAVEGRLVPTEAALARAEKSDYEPASGLLKRILADRRRRWEEAELAKLKAAGKSPKDDKWKSKYDEPKPADTKGLPDLPEGWCWASVDELTDGARRLAYGVLVPGDDVPGGVPFIRVGDIHEGTVTQSNLKYIDRTIADQFPRTYVRGGEILISLVGTIGRTAVVPAPLEGANVARAVGVFPATSLASARWAELWFRSPRTRASMEGKAHEVARKTLNLEDVRVAPVALPPATEQERLVAEIENLDTIGLAAGRTITAARARCGRLRQSVLKWAFDGKLVDQDPNDEPAAQLLARIRAERANSPAPKKARRARGTS